MSKVNKQHRTCAIIVTYNRLDLLKQCVDALRAQTRCPDRVLVINNSSTDGTSDWLQAQGDIESISLPNEGPTPAFRQGMVIACQDGFDWIWVMDDDSSPEPKALENLLVFANQCDEPIGYLTPAVVWKDGSMHRMNGQHKFEPGLEFYKDLANGAMRSTYASFVGLLVSSQAVRSVGLPIAEYKIWFDDVEFTERINRSFRSWLVFGSRVQHATPENHSPGYTEVTSQNVFKFRCGIRNKVHVIRSRYNMRVVGSIWAILWLGKTALQLMRGRSRHTITLLASGVSGLWFNPRIQHVQDTS